MQEHPLLMQGPLVRATLAGLKTQTRRPIKPRPDDDIVDVEYDAIADLWLGNTHEDNDLGYTSSWAARCPLGKAGDRLWVRETWQHYQNSGQRAADFPEHQKFAANCFYRADESNPRTKPLSGKWRPSLLMPRWACRLVLPLVSVRVERVQGITDEDAEEEGIREWAKTDPKLCALRAAGFAIPSRPKFLFRLCWISIYGEGSWDANPWVWVAQWDHIEARK